MADFYCTGNRLILGTIASLPVTTSTSNKNVSLVRYNGSADQYKIMLIRFEAAGTAFFNSDVDKILNARLVQTFLFLPIETVKAPFSLMNHFNRVTTTDFNGSTDSVATLQAVYDNAGGPSNLKAGSSWIFNDTEVSNGDRTVWDISGSGNLQGKDFGSPAETYGTVDLMRDGWNPITDEITVGIYVNYWSFNTTVTRKVNNELDIGAENSGFKGLQYYKAGSDPQPILYHVFQPA
jgi:hypothetical protein